MGSWKSYADGTDALNSGAGVFSESPEDSAASIEASTVSDTYVNLLGTGATYNLLLHIEVDVTTPGDWEVEIWLYGLIDEDPAYLLVSDSGTVASGMQTFDVTTSIVVPEPGYLEVQFPGITAQGIYTTDSYLLLTEVDDCRKWWVGVAGWVVCEECPTYSFTGASFFGDISGGGGGYSWHESTEDYWVPSGEAPGYVVFGYSAPYEIEPGTYTVTFTCDDAIASTLTILQYDSGASLVASATGGTSTISGVFSFSDGDLLFFRSQESGTFSHPSDLGSYSICPATDT